MTSIPPSPDGVRESLAELLEAAHNPSSLCEQRHEDLLAQVLGIDPVSVQTDPFAPATAREQAEATRLALCLEGQDEHDLSDLIGLLTSVRAPGELSQLGLTRAMKAASLAPLTPANRRAPIVRPAQWRRAVATSAATILALAAAAVLVFRTQPQVPVATSVERQTDYATSRSLSPLFVTESTPGTSTERMDRIVMVRSRDLRHNRYLSWRVR